MTGFRNKALLSILWLCVGPLSLRAQEAPKDLPVDLPKYFELTQLIGTGGQPTNAGFRLLAEKGYKAVINLRTADEGVDLVAEEKAFTDLGLKYYSIPVMGKEPRDEQAMAFLKLMDSLKDDKVFVHCAAANRVGGFMVIYRVLKDGIPLEKAEEEARQIGLRSENLVQFAHDFISRQRQ
jgi:protein tyrosine phosphatase (PTP) superfamily phosphohydrolase (DUF442 family)